MYIKKELVEISSILAEEYYPELAGEIMKYALALPEKHWGDDTERRDEVEKTSQVSRAVEYLSFQLMLPERQIQEAEETASSLNGFYTPLVFVKPEILESDHSSEEFSSRDQKEKWTSVRRGRVLRSLNVLLARISDEDSQDAP